MAKAQTMVNKLLTRLMFLPGLAVNETMYRLGRWRRYDEIDETLWMGALPRARDLHALHRRGVRLIINLCEEFRGRPNTMATLGQVHLHLPCLDRKPPPTRALKKALEAIAQEKAQGGKVYVHCRAGKGRSALVALLYLIELGHAPQEADSRLRALRPQVNKDLHQSSAAKRFAALADN